MGTNLERSLLLEPCINADALHAWVDSYADINVPRTNVCPDHDAPFDYLLHTYFEPTRDLVVWAPRGGGKTKLGAVATMLDLLHKPHVEVRILAGSLEQAGKMWAHLVDSLQPLADYAGGAQFRARRVSLDSTGASCGVLTQSQKSVRGVRVQKLRCDEVELFDPDVWQAAQLVTRSKHLDAGAAGTVTVGGAVEAISTLHEPFGLMGRVVDDALSRGTRILKWCLLEVLEPCPPERDCSHCPLHPECQGRAKNKSAGFLPIDDAIAMKYRVSAETWDAEMLCRKPSVRDCVFPSFDESVHVTAAPPDAGAFDPGETSLSLDFGFAAPFVCLWIRTDPAGRTFVLDEYVQPGQTIAEHVAQIQARPWPAKRVTCDPAGSSHSDQTATSNVQYLRTQGYNVKFRKSLIQNGLEGIRAALKPAAGPPRLFVHPRCKRLVKALRGYHYDQGGSEVPVKDGEHDHLVDALRYHFVNAGSLGPGKPWRQY